MVARTVLSCLLVLALVRTTVAAEPPETESSATNLDISFASALSSTSVWAHTAAVASQGTVLPWQIDVEAALWIPVGGKVSNVDVNADEFDSGVGTMGWVRFDGVNRTEGLGVFAEVTTLDYEVQTSTPALTADVNQQVLDVGPIYRTVLPIGGLAIELDIYGGFRYQNIDYNEVGTATFNEDLYEVMVGVKAMNFLSDTLRLEVRGSLSGFDLSDDATTLTWEVRAAIGFDVTNLITIRAGYRGMGVEYDARTVTFTYDTIVHGPFVGASIQF
ncbi:MAG: hypothetical protein V3T48_02420 [Vicinamibacterales bacterium]